MFFFLLHFCVFFSLLSFLVAVPAVTWLRGDVQTSNHRLRCPWAKRRLRGLRANHRVGGAWRGGAVNAEPTHHYRSAIASVG